MVQQKRRLTLIHRPESSGGLDRCVEGFEQPLEEYNPYDTLGNSIQANEKVMQMNFAGSRNITTDRFDYKKLGRATADAIGKSGLKITIDDRELGRIVKGYN